MQTQEKKRSSAKRESYQAEPEKKQTAERERYQADPEKKQTAERERYKADPEKKWSAKGNVIVRVLNVLACMIGEESAVRVRGRLSVVPTRPSKKYYRQSYSKVCKCNRERYHADPEKKRSSAKRESYQAEPEKKQTAERERYQADPEKKQTAERERYKADPEKKWSAKGNVIVRVLNVLACMIGEESAVRVRGRLSVVPTRPSKKYYRQSYSKVCKCNLLLP